MRLPSLVIGNQLFGDTYTYSWNYNTEDLMKIRELWTVLFAMEHDWDLPEGTSRSLVQSLKESGLTSSEVRELWTFKNGKLANPFVFGATTAFNWLSHKALTESASVVEKLSPLLG